MHQDGDSAVDTSVFYGRERELAQLWQWIVGNRCRVVGVLGMGGIDKSSIAVKAALQMQAEFEIIVWRSLTHAPSLTELLSSLLKFLMPLYGEDPVIPPTLDEKFSKLMEYLRSRRCLLMLDNVEVILDPQRVGQWRQGFEGYGQLLKTIGETPHQSCLLFTSREQPSEITVMKGRQGTCAALSLQGITPTDGRTIFEQKGEFTGTTAQWQQLIHHYGGNPLMLKLVAAATQELFDGNITEVIADLDRLGGAVLSETLRERERGILGFEDISDLLDRQFKRLSTAEQQVLFCLAIHRKPVSIARIRESIVGLAPEQSVPKQVNSLMRRSIVEKTDGLFCLQPVVMEYVIDYLR